MKTIGIIGGMSWESTVPYYEIINETVKAELGGLHSAKILLYSVDFEEIEHYQANAQWDESARVLTDIARRLEQAGADFIVIATNTMHKVYDTVQATLNVPVLHIADLTADALAERSIKKVGLLGTKYTMLQDFYKQRLTDRGFEVLIPPPADVEIVNGVIYNELCLGQTKGASRTEFQRIINEFKDAGAQGVILGCTEVGLLIKQKDSALPVFDTTEIHARGAALRSLQDCFTIQ